MVGTGLIGTSIAQGLINHGLHVVLSDVDPQILGTAITKSGARAWDSSENIDLAIIATPPAVVARIIKELIASQPHAVITDVSSVKGSIFNSLHDVSDSDKSRLVGGHPMAGREVKGPESALGDLFVDRPWVISATEVTSQSAIDLVRELATTLGAVPIERSLVEHDRAVALVSHTPQIVSSVLAGQLRDANESDVELAGQGIRDTTRIASSDPELWSQILSGNALEVAEQVTLIANRLHGVADALRDGDSAFVREVLVQGNAGRDRLPGKHGGAVRISVATVMVRLDDKPGELARLFAVAASANVNLEDVRIDHSLGRMTGLVELAVAKDAQSVLVKALISAEFVVVR